MNYALKTSLLVMRLVFRLYVGSVVPYLVIVDVFSGLNSNVIAFHHSVIQGSDPVSYFEIGVTDIINKKDRILRLSLLSVVIL